MMITDPFNPDERGAQAKAGGGPRTAPIHPAMPDQHRVFFETLPYILAATIEPDGWPLATVLTGPPGFVQAPDPQTLRIAVEASPFTPGQVIALLGIDLATRRRNRANGHITTADPKGIEIHIQESFGNCPKYIQRRQVSPRPRMPGPTETLATIDPHTCKAISAADTVFVGSRARSGLTGADISHRGGGPGFVRVAGNRLTIPDFDGNRYYNTLGNFLGDDRGSLLFLDFDRGDLLQLQGRVTIDWTGINSGHDGRRSWSLDVERGSRRRNALPLHFSPPEPSPFLDHTGAGS